MVARTDFWDIGLFADGIPHDTFRRPRDDAPIAWNPGSDDTHAQQLRQRDHVDAGDLHPFDLNGSIAVVWRELPRGCDDLAVEEIRETPNGPALKFVHVDEVEAQEVVAQMHGDRRVGVHLKFLEWTKDRMVAFTYYDPGLILERHAHESDALVFVIEGDVEVGGHPCPPGTLIVLEKGAAFGPLIAGPEGCTFLECYGDDVRPAPVDKDGYFKLLAEQGIERLPNPAWEAPPGAPVRERGEEDNWS